jgi:hypothetical protein
MAFRLLRGRGKTPQVELSGGVYDAGVRLFQSLVPTVAGDGTGLIVNPAQVPVDIFGTVTSANSAHLVTLPAPVPGTRVSLIGNATGYDLRSSAPATVAINGGTGASAKTAVAASLLQECRCVTPTAWICNTYSSNGTEAAEGAAA